MQHEGATAQPRTGTRPPLAYNRRLLASALLALWLAWTVPAWLALNAPPTPLGDPAQLLENIARHTQLPTRQAVLLQQATPDCTCDNQALELATSARAAGLTVLTLPSTVMPYPVVVLDASHALVFAGSAQLERGCAGNVQPSWPLIARLLEHPGTHALFNPTCPC